jgi:hypothetical protein
MKVSRKLANDAVKKSEGERLDEFDWDLKESEEKDDIRVESLV